MGTDVRLAPRRGALHHLLGHPTDLSGHIDAHGPLAVALGRHESWQAALAANLDASGLLGRGGGGFPSATKLAQARAHGDGGTLVVNGMESEPASDKDKVLLTRSPHLVLDGAQFLAAACGARRIVVCVPAGRDGVAAAVLHAISERSSARYARVSEVIVRPPDRFVAGEESALANWIDSQTALPYFGPTRGCRCASGSEPLWYTTPRRWRTSPSSPGTAPSPSWPAGWPKSLGRVSSPSAVLWCSRGSSRSREGRPCGTS